MEGVIGKSEQQKLEEAKATTIKMHREGVLWYLRDRLQVVGRTQAEMMERRLSREVEKGKYLLWESRSSGMDSEMPMPDVRSGTSSKTNTKQQYQGSGVVQREMDEKRNGGSERGEELSAEQLQMFEKENKDMLKHYQSTLSQVRYVTHPPIHPPLITHPQIHHLQTIPYHPIQLSNHPPN